MQLKRVVLIVCWLVSTPLLLGSSCVGTLLPGLDIGNDPNSAPPNDGPPDTGPPVDQPNTCNTPAADRDAIRLADRMLQPGPNDSGVADDAPLRFDEAARNALIRGLDTALAAARERDPNMAQIHATWTVVVGGKVRLTLTPALGAALQSAAAADGSLDGPDTGDGAFDAVLQEIGAYYVEFSSPTGATLYIADCVAVLVARDRLEEVDGVSASEFFIAGDSSNIYANQTDAGWFLLFRHATGDCPAGCTYQEKSYFHVVGSVAWDIPVDVAEADPNFPTR